MVWSLQSTVAKFDYGPEQVGERMRKSTPASAMRKAIVAGVLGLTTLLPVGAQASSVLELLGAPTGHGFFGIRTIGSNSAVTYFNPALLVDAKRSLDLSFMAVGTQLSIQRSPKPAATDVADSIYHILVFDDGTQVPLTMPPLASDDLIPRTDPVGEDVRPYLSLGLVRKFMDSRFALGIYALLPATNIQVQRASFTDEREQYFSNRLHHELYGDRLLMTSVCFGLGARIMPWLAVGVGASMEMHTRASTPVYVPDGLDQSHVLLNSDISVENGVTPYLGIAATPTPQTRVGLTWHAPTENPLKGSNELMLWNYPYPAGEDTIVQEYQFTYGYEPQRIGIGLAWDQTKKTGTGLVIGAEGLYARWSQYRNRHGEAGNPIGSTEPDNWRDIFSGTVIVQYHSPDISGGVSLGYIPSPVLSQDGRTNYVDNARVRMGGGIEFRSSWVGMPVSVGLQFQVHHLLERSVTKVDAEIKDEFPDHDPENGVTVLDATNPTEAVEDGLGLQTNNPGYPGFTSNGWVFGAGLSLSMWH